MSARALRGPQCTPPPADPTSDEDLAEARRIREEAIATQDATAAATEERKSWFAATVRPVIAELQRRAELNGFGEEYTLSIQPKEPR